VVKTNKGIEIKNARLNVKTATPGFSFNGSNELSNEWYARQAGSDVDMGSNKITNLTDPTSAQDGATKKYVDANLHTSSLQNKLYPMGIPDDIVSTHFDGEISENIEYTGEYVTKIWDATGKENNYTASQSSHYTYNSDLKCLEMTSTSGQDMKGTLPSGASNATQPFSFTMVVELTETNSANWSGGVSGVFHLFGNGGARANAYWTSNGFDLFQGGVDGDSSNFWNPNISPVGTPLKLIVTVNYNTNNSNIDVYVNNRWYGVDSGDRSADEVIIGNDALTANNPHYGRIYECFYTHDSLSETQVGHIHNFLNDKWDVFVKPTVDIFAMSGQSNMVGKGDQEHSPNPFYGFFLDPQFWDNNRTRMDTIVDPVGRGVNYGVANTGSCIPAFCQQYYDETGRIPVILHVADRGTSIFVNSEWNPDYSGSNHLTDLIDILPLAETQLENMGWQVGRKCTLWHQGEQDNAKTVQEYKDQFLKLVDKCLNNGYDYFLYYEISRLQGSTDYDSVREAQRLAHQERDNLYMIWSCANLVPLGLTTDGVHYNQQGYNLMGREGAKTVAESIIGRDWNNWYSTPAYGDVDMNQHRIEDLANPISGSDSATKNYVDSRAPLSTLYQGSKAFYTFNGDYKNSIVENSTYDGTNMGTSFTTGIINQAIDTTGGKNWVDPNGLFDWGTNDFSVACWVYTSATGLQYIAGNFDGGSNFTMFNYNADNGNIFNMVTGGNTSATLRTTKSYPLGQWYFVVFNRTGSRGEIYVNGELDISGEVSTGNLSGTPSRSAIALSDTTNGNKTWEGTIDHFGVWDRILSENEVKYLYNQGKATESFIDYDYTFNYNVDMKQNQILNLGSAQTTTLTIADDSAKSITPANNRGVLFVEDDIGIAQILYDVANGSIQKGTQLGLITTATGNYTGTDGSDGQLTVSADGTNGQIDVENRTGSQTTVRILNIF
jgi:hypothetical protein